MGAVIGEMAREDFSDVRIIFVLGGPGAGKGTLCEQLAARYGFAHFSAGALLRQEAALPTPTGIMLTEMMAEGKIVPSHITIGLLKKNIEETVSTKTFLIDGFPRNISQGQEFESTITNCKLVLFLDAPQEIMQERILKRAEEAVAKGEIRPDDNLESLKKRFVTHYETCLPVIDYYKQQDKVAQVDAAQSIDEVCSCVVKICDALN